MGLLDAMREMRTPFSRGESAARARAEEIVGEEAQAEHAVTMTPFDPHACQAEVWWHPDLGCWALRLTHTPTETQITRYAGHSEGPWDFTLATLPTALEDIRWLVEHRGPISPGAIRVRDRHGDQRPRVFPA